SLILSCRTVCAMSFFLLYGALRVLHSFLHDALPICSSTIWERRRHELCRGARSCRPGPSRRPDGRQPPLGVPGLSRPVRFRPVRSEEHTSELQSRENLVCRLLLEKKKKNTNTPHPEQ